MRVSLGIRSLDRDVNEINSAAIESKIEPFLMASSKVLATLLLALFFATGFFGKFGGVFGLLSFICLVRLTEGLCCCKLLCDDLILDVEIERDIGGVFGSRLGTELW